MGRVAAWLRSFGDATVDVGLSVLGLLLVLVPTVSALHSLLGQPIAQQRLELALLIVVLVLASLFANSLFSLDWLGTYVLAFVCGVAVFGFVGSVVVAGKIISLSGEDALWPALVMAQGHAVAITIVWLDDVQLLLPCGEPRHLQ